MTAPEYPSVSSPTVVKDLLSRHGFRFKKQLGQNFLIDARVLDAIVEAAGLSPSDGAFEIGPGAGVVTAKLARAAKRVVAVEKDRALGPILGESLSGLDNVDIVFGDVLTEDLSGLWSRFSDCQEVSVIANLPYYITTPILFHLFESGVPIRTMVVMVQKEVADRLVADPGGKDYGALTVAVSYRARVEKVVRVSPSSFLPSPGVESMVVRLHFHPSPPIAVSDEQFLFRVVRAAFGLRRKTLENALAAGLGLKKEDVRGVLHSTSINPMRRGETLSLQEFGTLADGLYTLVHGSA